MNAYLIRPGLPVVQTVVSDPPPNIIRKHNDLQGDHDIGFYADPKSLLYFAHSKTVPDPTTAFGDYAFYSEISKQDSEAMSYWLDYYAVLAKATAVADKFAKEKIDYDQKLETLQNKLLMEKHIKEISSLTEAHKLAYGYTDEFATRMALQMQSQKPFPNEKPYDYLTRIHGLILDHDLKTSVTVTQYNPPKTQVKFFGDLPLYGTKYVAQPWIEPFEYSPEKAKPAEPAHTIPKPSPQVIPHPTPPKRRLMKRSGEER
jgi:hypothetical protein